MRQRSIVLLVLAIVLAFGFGFDAYVLRPETDRAGGTEATRTDWSASNQPNSEQLAAPLTSARAQAHARPNSAVQIAVTDDRGLPVPMVRVRATPLLGDPPRDPRPKLRMLPLASPDGVVTVPSLLPGRWRLEVYADGHWPRTGAEWPVVLVPTTGRVDVRIWRAGSIGGLVRGASGQPAPPGTTVRLWSGQTVPGQPLLTQRTDPSGRYDFPRLDPGARYSLAAGKDEGAQRIELQLQPGEHREAPDFILSPGGDLLITILDAAGQPCVDREMVLFIGSDPVVLRTTDGQGQVLLTDRPPGHLLILAEPAETGGDTVLTGSPADAELLRADAQVLAGQTVEVTLRESMRQSTQVQGTVRVNGNAAPDHRVYFVIDGGILVAGDSGTQTDAEGRFRTSVPRPELYRWIVAATKYGAPLATGLVEIRADVDDPLELDVLTGSLEIVLDPQPDEHPEWSILAGAMFSWTPGQGPGRPARVATPSAEGWLLEDLAPGPYLVRAMGAPRATVTASQRTEIVAGKTTRVLLRPWSSSAVSLVISAMAPPGRQGPDHLELTIWGAEPELLTNLYLPSLTVPITAQLPEQATQVAAIFGERVAVLNIGTFPWTQLLQLVGVPAGRIQIERQTKSAATIPLTPRVLDAGGHDWSQVPAQSADTSDWIRGLAVIGRWLSPPLPPGAYIVEAEGRAVTVQVRANERTILDW